MCNLGTATFIKGKAEGAQENAVKIATNLIKMGLGTLEQIAEATGLPIETVKELAASIETT